MIILSHSFLSINREQIIVVPDITGGVMCAPRVPEPQAAVGDLTQPSEIILPCTSIPGPAETPLSKDEQEEQEDEKEAEEEVKEEIQEEDENELGASCSEKRLSMESGYSASDKLLDTVDMSDLNQSEIPSDQLSLPPPQTDGKLANRDSGIDSISSPSHSEELCFAGDEDRIGHEREICPCSPTVILPRLSSSSSCGCVEGDVGEGATAAEGGRDSEGDSDLEEGSGDESEMNPMALQPLPKAERQDSVEVSLL